MLRHFKDFNVDIFVYDYRKKMVKKYWFSLLLTLKYFKYPDYPPILYFQIQFLNGIYGSMEM